MESLAIGAALALALSSALLEWARHVASQPALSYVLIFPILLLLAARATPVGPQAKQEGLALMFLATLIVLLSIATATHRLGRLAIPCGIIGLLRFTGKATHSTAGLAMFVVPIPHSIVVAAPLESVWLAFAEAIVGSAGPELVLDEWDGGLRLVALFAGLGWYAGAREGNGWRGALRRAGALAMLGLPVQMAATIVGVAMARAGAPDLARALLTHGVWMVAAAATIGAIERRAFRAAAVGVKAHV